MKEVDKGDIKTTNKIYIPTTSNKSDLRKMFCDAEIYLNEIGYRSVDRIDLDKLEKYVNEYLDEKSNKLRDNICEMCLQLVPVYAKRYIKFGVSADDLIQEGNMGILEGIETYEKIYGTKFLTHIVNHINWKMRNFATQKKSEIHLPTHIKTISNKINKITDMYFALHGQEPSIDAILGSDVLTDVEKIWIQNNGIPVSNQIFSYLKENNDKGSKYVDAISDTALNAFENMMKKGISIDQAKEMIDHYYIYANTNVDSEDKVKNILLFMTEYIAQNSYHTSLTNTGARFGISHERVRQIRNDYIVFCEKYYKINNEGILVRQKPNSHISSHLLHSLIADYSTDANKRELLQSLIRFFRKHKGKKAGSVVMFLRQKNITINNGVSKINGMWNDFIKFIVDQGYFEDEYGFLEALCLSNIDISDVELGLDIQDVLLQDKGKKDIIKGDKREKVSGEGLDEKGNQKISLSKKDIRYFIAGKINQVLSHRDHKTRKIFIDLIVSYMYDCQNKIVIYDQEYYREWFYMQYNKVFNQYLNEIAYEEVSAETPEENVKLIKNIPYTAKSFVDQINRKISFLNMDIYQYLSDVLSKDNYDRLS